jgi:dTDP-4-amino-4,6-dideoxygalactose transaminase
MYQTIESIIPVLETKGFSILDPWDVVDAFEVMVAEYAGSKFAVSCDSCTNAMFMSLKFLKAKGTITIPSKTYLSVPGMVVHSGCKIQFEDYDWSGIYKLEPYPVIDGATRFTKGMYVKDTFHCLSFHIKKILPICKGGMILTDNEAAYNWFKLARYEGRNNRIPHNDIDDIEILGWNFYMPPEQAAQGIAQLLKTPETNADSGGSWSYKDLSGFSAWDGYLDKP